MQPIDTTCDEGRSGLGTSLERGRDTPGPSRPWWRSCMVCVGTGVCAGAGGQRQPVGGMRWRGSERRPDAARRLQLRDGVRCWLWARRLGQEQLLNGPEADRLQQHVVEATSEEALLLLRQHVGGVGDHP